MASRSAKWTKFFEKCHLVRYSSIFWALPGAHAPVRVHSPFKTTPYGSLRRRLLLCRRATWLVETEIAFSVEEQHFIGTTAGQITRRVFSSKSNSGARALLLQFGACICLAWTPVFWKFLQIQPFVWNKTAHPG